MKSTVTGKGQTTIPSEIRKALNIQSHSELLWDLKDGVIEIRPIPRDPVRASLGFLRGLGITNEFLLDERRRERRREN